MFIKRNKKIVGNKLYQTILLVEGYREDGRVKHRTVANLSQMPETLVSAIEQSLQGNASSLVSKSGKSYGGIYVIRELAKSLHITKALGHSNFSKLAQILISGRILTQGSRRHLTFWQNGHAISDVFGVEKFNTDNLYDTLDWLQENQLSIEKKLFKFRKITSKASQPLFLYDITSSYLEGEYNELAEYGYNRDGKKGKKQVVIGLLTDDVGYPVSIEVFDGNTSDSTTVPSQIKKLANEFNVDQLIFVGDRGMVKSAGIQTIQNEENWNYITAITKPQIEKLIKSNVFTAEEFADTLCEVENDGIRYILKRNPIRAKDIQKNRSDKLKKIQDLCSEYNKNIFDKNDKSIFKIHEKIQDKINRLKLNKILAITVEIKTKHIEIVVKDDELQQESRLDGCYAIKTDVTKDAINTNQAHTSYKNLKFVEWAFRSMKTGFLEIRPIFHRKATRTRGLAVVAMLAYMIIFEIWQRTKELNVPLEEIIDSLEQLQTIEFQVSEKWITTLPTQLRDDQKKYLNALNIKVAKMGVVTN